MQKKLIVSIDGGGIRGVIPLLLLKEIQERLNKDFFDLKPQWWGTSTGAIISGALSIQQPLGFATAVQSTLDLYEFRSSSSIQPQGASIPSRALDQLIDANFKGLHISDFPQLNILASEESTHNPVVFNASNPGPLDLVIKASCAFPGLFPPVEINGQVYVDGFFGAKNPTQLAHDAAEEQELIVISLGTGILRANDSIEEHVQAVHNHMLGLSAQGQVDYFRFNPALSFAVDAMQNVSPKNIMNLRKDTLAYIPEIEEELMRLIRLLA